MAQDTVIKIVAAIVIGVLVIGLAIYIVGNSSGNLRDQSNAVDEANTNLSDELKNIRTTGKATST